MRDRFLEFVPGLLAGVVAGVAGYYLVSYLSGYGYWAPIIPGALAGLACGQLSPSYSRRRGVVLALFTAGLVVFTQWSLLIPAFPYDGTLVDYIKHLHQLPPLSLILMAVNVLIAYWWGREQGINFARRFNSSKLPVERTAADEG